MKSRSIDMRGGGEAGLQAQAGGAPQGSANVKGVKETRFPPKKCLKINIYLKKFVTKTSASASAQRCAALGSARCCRGRSCARTSQGRYGIFLKYFPENKCKKAFWSCYNKVLDDVPVEVCELAPERVCQDVSRLVPRLEPTQRCVLVPKEVNRFLRVLLNEKYMSCSKPRFAWRCAWTRAASGSQWSRHGARTERGRRRRTRRTRRRPAPGGGEQGWGNKRKQLNLN